MLQNRPSADSVFPVSSPELPELDGTVLGSAQALNEVFAEGRVRQTIRRMRSRKETENEVTHPLRTMILLAFEESLAASLSAAVPKGGWSPSPAYVVLVAKRSGTFRELTFPNLIDVIVGRRIIDSLEPLITRDDNKRAFFGRSHSNSDRRRGDYENWFKVWLDFSAEIGVALQRSGFTYVFDTDITQFFPSVDRERAKRALAQRTSAHQSLLELLFYCLDTWAPRVGYCAVPGLPIEPNDVSRLVAHNYIKSVDEKFVNDPTVHYLRWVDDTVIFVPDENTAHEVKRKHHLALREVGLSPNSSKTLIQRSELFSAARHPEFNKKISDAKAAAQLQPLVADWFGRDPAATPSWDKVATRLYSTVRMRRLDVLRDRAVSDIVGQSSVNLQKQALRYLSSFEILFEEVIALVKYFNTYSTTTESLIEVARFLCDARLADDRAVPAIINLAVGQLLTTKPRDGSGYARSLLLLVLNKHGDKEARKKVMEGLPLHRLDDDQLRLHFLYVFKCRGELDVGLESSARHLDTSDIALTMRLCEDAYQGRISNHLEVLDACISASGASRTVLARHLPFLSLLLRAKGREAENLGWLRKVTSGPKAPRFLDRPVLKFLAEECAIATR